MVDVTYHALREALAVAQQPSGLLPNTTPGTVVESLYERLQAFHPLGSEVRAVYLYNDDAREYRGTIYGVVGISKDEPHFHIRLVDAEGRVSTILLPGSLIEQV